MSATTPKQLRAMQEGRERAYERRQEESAERVRAFTDWLRSGGKIKEMPSVPTSADYRRAKR